MTLNPKAIARAAEVGIPFKDLKSPSKKRRLVGPRHHFWWLLVKREGFSLERAGRVTGHHHTTVLYGIRQYQARMSERSAA
jgi:chromosomal replication initiation ATPase DnaA